ncbi:transposase [Microbulbifer sp. GL-2]
MWYLYPCTKKALFGTLRREVELLFRALCHQKDIELVEGYVMRDHIHML